jgi:RimJ/RimL family protein N-acetyltransferase
VRHLPILDIRIRSPRLELRLPDLEMLDELASLAGAGIHPPETMPFGEPWTDLPSPELERATVRWHLLRLATWSPLAWNFNPVVLYQGKVIGSQGINSTNFVVTRSVTTGSWLGRAYQGQGLGREMRAAILEFGFSGLGAQVALSAAFRDNAASLAVSRSLGYQDNGEAIVERRGRPAEQIHLRLTRERWERRDRPLVELEGVELCREFFGV